MRLQISLRHNIESVFITELIPVVIIGVVAGTHSVHVQLLHHQHILTHTLTRDIIAAIGIHLMAICTLNENRLTIDEQLPIRHTHIPKAYTLADDLTTCHQLQSVEVWIFCRPKVNTFKCEGCTSPSEGLIE